MPPVAPLSRAASWSRRRNAQLAPARAYLRRAPAAVWSCVLAWIATAWLVATAALQSRGVALAFDAWAKLGISVLAWSCLPVALAAASGAPQRATQRAGELMRARGYSGDRLRASAHWALLPWTLLRVGRGAALLIVLGALLAEPRVAPLHLLALLVGAGAYATALGVAFSAAAGWGFRTAGRRGGWALLGLALALELGLWIGFDSTLVGVASRLLNTCLAVG